MCNQDEIQSMSCGQFQCYNPDQYENAETLMNCDEPQCYESQPACETNYPIGFSPNQIQQCYQQCPTQSPQMCYQPQVYRPPSCQQVQCDPSFQRCDPCEPLGPYPMPCQEGCEPRTPCPPLELCSPMCSPYRQRRYVQPPRRESCKPIINYQRPQIPMTSDTVYKQSFDYIDSQKSSRTQPIFPVGQLQTPRGEFAKETVTKLSFQRQCCPERTRIIYPIAPSLLGQGPMQGMTTQKHDFVPKFQFKRSKCVPLDHIHRGCGGIERETIQRLSFMRPDIYTRTESCKPIINYKPPELPMEFETTQKLSFMPVCPAPKEDMPWARRAQYCRPTLKFAKDTVAKLSFQPPGCFLDNNCCCEDKICNEPARASC